MKSNLGTLDSAIRITAGLALIVATLLSLVGPWGWLGVVLIATGVFRFCPAYRLFGLNTCPLKK